MKVYLELNQWVIKHFIAVLSKLFHVAFYCIHKYINFIFTYVISKYISIKNTNYNSYIIRKLFKITKTP